jgi:hypothetical protein
MMSIRRINKALLRATTLHQMTVVAVKDVNAVDVVDVVEEVVVVAVAEMTDDLSTAMRVAIPQMGNLPAKQAPIHRQTRMLPAPNRRAADPVRASPALRKQAWTSRHVIRDQTVIKVNRIQLDHPRLKAAAVNLRHRHPLRLSLRRIVRRSRITSSHLALMVKGKPSRCGRQVRAIANATNRESGMRPILAYENWP